MYFQRVSPRHVSHPLQTPHMSYPSQEADPAPVLSGPAGGRTALGTFGSTDQPHYPRVENGRPPYALTAM